MCLCAATANTLMQLQPTSSAWAPRRCRPLRWMPCCCSTRKCWRWRCSACPTKSSARCGTCQHLPEVLCCCLGGSGIRGRLQCGAAVTARLVRRRRVEGGWLTSPSLLAMHACPSLALLQHGCSTAPTPSPLPLQAVAAAVVFKPGSGMVAAYQDAAAKGEAEQTLKAFALERLAPYKARRCRLCLKQHPCRSTG